MGLRLVLPSLVDGAGPCFYKQISRVNYAQLYTCVELRGVKALAVDGFRDRADSA